MISSLMKLKDALQAQSKGDKQNDAPKQQVGARTNILRLFLPIIACESFLIEDCCRLQTHKEDLVSDNSQKSHIFQLNEIILLRKRNRLHADNL